MGLLGPPPNVLFPPLDPPNWWASRITSLFIGISPAERWSDMRRLLRQLINLKTLHLSIGALTDADDDKPSETVGRDRY